MTIIEKIMGTIILGGFCLAGGWYGMHAINVYAKQDSDAEKVAHTKTCQMIHRVVKKELDHNMVSVDPPRSHELQWLANVSKECDDVPYVPEAEPLLKAEHTEIVK